MTIQKNKFKQPILKKLTCATFVFMLLGVGLELYLLSHYEDTLQTIPLFCIGSIILLSIIIPFKRSVFLLTLFKVILVATALSGIYGTFLHLRANYEFEIEMKPNADNWDLFTESLSGALPALAPGSMIVLALIGYSYILLLKQKQ